MGGPRAARPEQSLSAADPARARPAAPAPLNMQQAAGNRAVAQWLATHPVQRDTPTATPTAEAPVAPPGARTALARAQQIRLNATARLGNIAAFNAVADESIATYRDRHLRFAQRWATAWDRHHQVLEQGQAQAESENLYEGLAIGLAIGLMVAAAGPLIATAGPAAAAIANAEAFTATWWGFQAAGGVVSGGAGALVGPAVGRPDVAGAVSGRSDAERDVWRQVAVVEERTRRIAALAPKFGLELGNAEYSIAQVQAHIDRATTDMSWDDTLNLVSTLANWENQLAGFDAVITDGIGRMQAFGAAAADFTIPSVDELERQIWDIWMSRLDTPDKEETIDQDVIQHHLVALGLIHDYFYMSDADQHREVLAARARVAARGEPTDGQ